MKNLSITLALMGVLVACSSDNYVDYDTLAAIKADRQEYAQWLPVQYLPKSAYNIHISRTDENDFGIVRFRYDKKAKLTAPNACSEAKKTKHFEEHRCSHKQNNIVIEVRDGYGKIKSSLKHKK